MVWRLSLMGILQKGVIGGVPGVSQGFDKAADAPGGLDAFVQGRHQGQAGAMGPGILAGNLPREIGPRQEGDVGGGEEFSGERRVQDGRDGPEIETRVRARDLRTSPRISSTAANLAR